MLLIRDFTRIHNVFVTNITFKYFAVSNKRPGCNYRPGGHQVPKKISDQVAITDQCGEMWKSQLVTRRQWPKFRYETMPKSWILSLVMQSRPLQSCLLPTLLGFISEIPKTSNLLWIQLLTRSVKTLKKISDQAAIRATRVDFFSKINKRPWSFIRDRRVLMLFMDCPLNLEQGVKKN